MIAVNCPEPSAATVMADLAPIEVTEGVAEGVESVDVVMSDALSSRDGQLSLEKQTVPLEGLLWAATSPSRETTKKDRIVPEELFDRNE